MAIKMLITDAGLAEVVNAEQSGTAPVVLSHIAFGTGQYTPTADMTALKSEFKRFDSIKGGAVADNVIHISLHDTDKQAYTVYEVGVFTESGTLFAVCSQLTPIVQKAEDAEVMLVTDFVLSDIDVDSITIGDTNFILNPATTTTKGIVELATESEAKSGTDTTKAMTPATTKAAIDDKASKYLPLAGGTLTGTVFTTADGAPVLSAKKGSLNGGRVFLFSPDNATYSGGIVLRAFNSDNSVSSDLTLKADGTITWKDKDITLEGDCLPVSGGAMTTTKAMTRDVNNSFLGLHGGTGENNDGAQLYLCGSNHPSAPSSFQLHARNAETDKVLRGNVDGTLDWDDKHVLNNSFLMPSDSGAINITAGTSSAGGAYFRLYGKEHSSGEGQFVLAATDGESTNALVGKPDGALTWKGNEVLCDNKITNCITEIPQDIKLELNDGTLTLKAGSKVYVPNGFEADGSNKFDVVVVESDIVRDLSNDTTAAKQFINIYTQGNTLSLMPISISSSGTAEPTGTKYYFYNTEENRIYASDKVARSLPIGIFDTGTKSIDQVFNGFGYIGSTVFALPNVKGLIPNGRNADGSLKNIEFTTGTVRTYTNKSTRNNAYLALSAKDSDDVGRVNEFEVTDDISQSSASGVIYSPTLNKSFISGGTEWKWAIIGQWSSTSTSPFNVTSLQPKLPFRAVDYNDSSWISGLGMPSGRYISLTLGASGSSYTAPANGWFFINKVTSGSNQFVALRNESKTYTIGNGVYGTGSAIYCLLPVQRGDVVIANYTASGTTNSFRFIYAEGEN